MTQPNPFVGLLWFMVLAGLLWWWRFLAAFLLLALGMLFSALRLWWLAARCASLLGRLVESWPTS